MQESLGLVGFALCVLSTAPSQEFCGAVTLLPNALAANLNLNLKLKLNCHKPARALAAKSGTYSVSSRLLVT
jgi:hypothetical protein